MEAYLYHAVSPSTAQVKNFIVMKRISFYFPNHDFNFLSIYKEESDEIVESCERKNRTFKTATNILHYILLQSFCQPIRMFETSMVQFYIGYFDMRLVPGVTRVFNSKHDKLQLCVLF